MKKKKRTLTVTISNPEALDKAGERFTKLLYEMYIKSLSKEDKISNTRGGEYAKGNHCTP
jgi:hypothetical protein